jgi:hypothetical protein
MNDNPGLKRPKDNWANGNLYERYVGRWSRPVAREFLRESQHWIVRKRLWRLQAVKSQIKEYGSK